MKKGVWIAIIVLAVLIILIVSFICIKNMKYAKCSSIENETQKAECYSALGGNQTFPFKIKLNFGSKQVGIE